MDEPLRITWLGISGVELRCGVETVLIDPVFSRVGLLCALFGRVRPDVAEAQAQAPGCGRIFITHAHHDHLMDTPAIAASTGAAVFGSMNACAIAGACGVEEGKLTRLVRGGTYNTAAFAVTALGMSHINLPGFGYGRLPRRLSPPLRASHYRMDECFAFLVQAGGRRLLVGPGLCLDDPGGVDALLCDPIYLGRNLEPYLQRIGPRIFLPIHWEDMFRPAARPPRPGLVPGFPPRRLDLACVERRARALGVRYLLPERGKAYTLDEIV